MRGLLATAALFAGPVWSEGRDDPIMRCHFDDREILLSEDGDGILWTEGDSSVAAACVGFGSPVAACLSDHADLGPAVVAIATARAIEAPPPGTATLSHSVVNPGGTRLMQTVTHGHCEEQSP